MQGQHRTDTAAHETGSRPLLHYLWALIVCSVIPLLAFQAYAVTRTAQAETRLAETQAERITHALGNVMDRKLTELEAGLAVLAHSPELEQADLAAFRRAAVEFSHHTGVQIELLGADGQGLLDTSAPPHKILQRTAHPRVIEGVLRTGRMHVLNAFERAADKSMRAGMAYPVIAAGRPARVLLATWSLPGIGGVLYEARIPEGWPAAVVDARGVRLWRSSHPELIGQPLLPSFFKALKEPKRHVNTSATDLQTEVVNFSSTLNKADWTVIVAVPRAELQAPYNRALLLLSGAGALALLLGVGVAAWITRRVRDEVRRTAAQAHGDAHAGAPLAIREMRELSGAISEAERARRVAEQALRISEERWKFALEGAGAGVWDWDMQSGELVVSRRWLDMLGYADCEGGRHVNNWAGKLHPEDAPVVRAKLREYLAGKVSNHRIEYRLAHKDGGWVWVVSRGMLASRTADGRPLRLIGTNFDITERKRMEHELRQMATTDFLTGLGNRRCFIARLEEELGRLQRNRASSAVVLMLDIDHFKKINDTRGHAAGDAVLCQFADLIQEMPRKSDFVSRLGGEEFAILLSATTMEEAELAARRLCEQVAYTPMHAEGQAFHITVSIGLAAMDAHDVNAAAVLSRADAALYRAKEAGRNRVEVQV